MRKLIARSKMYAIQNTRFLYGPLSQKTKVSVLTVQPHCMDELDRRRLQNR